ncbi:bifunctional enoyl-CoA hydratase/phosphate acetyltransferase [Lampropedia cohaerens]|uniref:Bifunctional enoyl-CoA hydratase/phosphate acetyltransferase n=1 Tax=Lampropedia cohaerens TaxID=1610491 RepID=A0A0U1Q163_9BURK|nr:bifunctional enoyl-CoA hydratase/phosphate acetyltransferase [Lampropedia cohaerens]KKW68335.1 bifunctional enoyl-CoA hydratase/phosphate acetyltransferase [Lampropedia cohaerens]
MRLTNRTYDELHVGDHAELRRLITQDDLYVFAAASGNYNPMHLPSTDVDGDGVPENIAPAVYVVALISSVLGNLLPGPGTLFRSHHFKVHARAHAGDELLLETRVLDKCGDNVVRLHTRASRLVDGQCIIDGEAEVIAPAHKFDRDDIEIPGLLVQRHRHFDALIERARQLPAVPVAVVCPDDPNSLGGALLAAREGIIVPLLVGDGARIRATAEAMGEDLSACMLIEEAGDDQRVAQRACTLVHEGRAASVMKGHLHTDDLLRPMLDRSTGLRIGRRFTHVFIMDVPGRSEPLLVTDAAINIAPDLATKVDIVQNAIDLAAALGLKPRAGVLSAVETVNPAIQSSIDAALLSKMAERGQIKGGLVDGPLAMDNAVDVGAARTKGLSGGVAGQANILVVPDIDAGNMLAKQLTFVSHAEGAGVVLGAKVPVILNSRSDSPKARLASCAIAALHHAYHLNTP